MLKRLFFALSGFAALAVIAAAPAPRLVREDVQAAAETEAYAVLLGRSLAMQARREGDAVLGQLFEDWSNRNARALASHGLAEDKPLTKGLRAAVGVIIRQRQAYGAAALHAGAIGDPQAGAAFDRLNAEAARDRDAIGEALRVCLGNKPCRRTPCA